MSPPATGAIQLADAVKYATQYYINSSTATIELTIEPASINHFLHLSLLNILVNARLSAKALAVFVVNWSNQANINSCHRGPET
jgi:hypothetical protein